ncbi:MAG TPA: hypothetical protein VJM81_08175, partial [Rhizorhapis sp.]|nr:hypothetical protein [Rhizorhapis sp.]
NARGGEGFVGGRGTGGTITITAQDGIFASDGDMFLSADGFGGYEMTGGTAGDGTGGTVLLQLLPGTANSAAMTFGNLNVHADGYGLPIPGDYFGSGNGGTGTGGSVRVDVLGGLLSAQSIMLGAVGLGGEAGESAGATAFIAADGFGGTAIFNVNGGFADITGMLALSTLGTGGFARSPSSPGNLMAAGGNGTGGTSQLMVASGTLNAGDIFIHAYGLGGNTDEVSDSDATSGGNGFGGTAAVALNAGASITATSLEILASGEGGAGGDSFGFGNAGSGGNGNGGSARFDAQDASYDLPTLSLAAQGIGGAAGSAGSGLAGAVGDGTGGTTRFSNGGTAAPTGVRRVGDLSFNVSGTGTTIFSGRMEVSNTAGSGGGLAVTGDLIATGTGPAANGAGFYFTGAGDSLSIGGAATISTGGNAEFNLDGAGSFAVTGALQLDAGQNIIVRHSNQTASPTASILADSINLASLGFIQGESGSLFSGASSMTFSSGGYIVTDRLRSGGPVLLNAANGIVSVATDLDASGMVQSTGQAINIRSLGILNVALATASAGDLSIVADNGLILGSGTASGGIALGSTSGDLAIGNLAAASIQISSFGTASFSGLSDAGIISVSSGNIVIGTNAQLGTAGNTALLTLANSRTMNPTFVGGGDSASGYSLSAAEMLRLFSDDIAISGTFGGSAEPDLVVDSFSMASRASVASGNLGANGSLSILSGGDIQIVGDVALTGLGAENQLFFTASGTTGPGAIEVDAENASIRLSDSNGGIIGRVNFEAAEVFMATADAISDVRAAQDTDAISARLALNDVVVRDSIISAGTIFANVDEGLYIQNVGASDAFADRRGFAALTDTLDISTGSAATRIIVNGQLVQTTGAMLSGLDVIPLVRINGVVGPSSGNFDQRSTVNGCLIASPVLCTVNIDELPNLPPPHDNIRDPLEVGESGTGSDLFPTMVVELKDFEPFGYPPLIDEPVTGAGNDDLWMPACEAGGERAGCTEPGQD